MKKIKVNLVERIREEMYTQILENMPIPCVDVIVHNENAVLLVKRNNKPAKGEWWPPGGRVFKNEKLEDGAIRKVLEETGLDVKIERQTGTYETMFEEGPLEELRGGVHTINTCYLAKCIGGSFVKLDKTSSDYRWFEKIEDNLPDYTKMILRDSRFFDRSFS